jgi:hypothetical protein
MGNQAPPSVPSQHFPPTELLFHRVHKNNVSRGKATHFAFALPDMSCNRQLESTAEEARKGHDPQDWGVAAFLVEEIPSREALIHLAQLYRLLARHVPLPGNFAHCEVRVWRFDGDNELLLTERKEVDFRAGDPDTECTRGLPAEWLDPDFHMKWRRRIAKASTLPLGPRLAG